MEAKAVWKFARISPQKMRLVADTIRGKDINSALNIVKFTNKKAAGMLEKVVKSAVANIESKNESENIDVNELYIKSINIDGGSTLKRFRPRAMGRASKIRKRTSHITVVVANNQAVVN